MHLIYTLNTHNHLNGRWGMMNGEDVLTKTIYMYALSIAWAKMWHSHITIKTDALGHKLLQGLPVEIQKVSMRTDELWALSKIDSIRNQEAPFCHVDGDFVMRTPINLKTNSILCDRIEKDNFHHHYTPWLSTFKEIDNDKIVHWWESHEAWAPNCGIISIANNNILDQIIEGIEYYEKIYFQTKQRPTFKYIKDKLDPNCVVEQFGIRRACEMNGVEIDFINNEKDQEHQRLLEIEKGYKHYYGFEKYDDVVIEQVKKELIKFFPIIYKTIQSNLIRWKNTL